jgi:hypothetical protein
MVRETNDCYRLFHQHQVVFDASTNFIEFCDLAKLFYLLDYKNGWVEQAYWTLKAGKETYRGLRLPNANKFSDLFTQIYLIETNQRDKPEGAKFIGGSAGFAKHLGGTRGWSKTCPDTRSQYGSKFYGSYVVPIENINFKDTSFEAITRTDGILITIRSHDYTGCDWIALLALSENIRTYYDDKTKAFLAIEREAEIAAWGDSKL